MQSGKSSYCRIVGDHRVAQLDLPYFGRQANQTNNFVNIFELDDVHAGLGVTAGAKQYHFIVKHVGRDPGTGCSEC